MRIDMSGSQSFAARSEQINEILKSVGATEAYTSSEHMRSVFDTAMQTEAGQKLYGTVTGTFQNELNTAASQLAQGIDTLRAACPELEAGESPAIDFQAAKESILSVISTGSERESNVGSRDAYSEIDKHGINSEPTSDVEVCQKTRVNSSMLEYIKNPSNSPMNAGNVTEMDRLVISDLAYSSKYVKDAEGKYYRKAMFEGKAGESTTVGEYCTGLTEEMEAQMRNGEKVNAADYQFLKEMSTSKRYSGLKLDYSKCTSTKGVDTQIVAVSDGNGYAMIGVQGTNGTIADWKYDAEFANSDPTEEEMYVTQQTEQIIREKGYNCVDLTGHSQGGREAVSAAAFSNDETRAKIRSVYSLDGPGYSKAFWDKHGDKLNGIKERVTNIRPKDSYVGRIYTGVGSKKYVETIDGLFSFKDHSQYHWVGDANSGELTEISKTGPEKAASDLIGYVSNVFEGEDNPSFAQMMFTIGNEVLGLEPSQMISNIANGVIDFVGNTLSEQQASQLTDVFLGMAYDDENPTELNFRAIVNHLDELSLGDIAIIVESGLTIICQGVSDIAGKIKDISAKAGAICTVLAKVSGAVGLEPVAAFFAAAAGVMKKIELVAKHVKIVCDVAVFVFKKIAEIREKRRTEQRTNYINRHPQIVFVRTALQNAAECLEEANKYILQADADCDGIRRGFQKSEEDEEGILHWILHVFGTIQAVFSYFSIAGADLIYLKNQPLLTKGSRVCNRLAEVGYTVAKSVPNSSNDEQFTVNPGALSSAGAAGGENGEKGVKTVEQILEEVGVLGASWEGEDYTKTKSDTEKAVEGMKKDLEAVKSAFAMLSEIATIYSGFQETSVKEFQSAAN